jgi:hypothetical protein
MWKAVQALEEKRYLDALFCFNEASFVAPFDDQERSLNFLVGYRAWVFTKLSRPEDALGDLCLSSYLRFPPEREYIRLEISGELNEQSRIQRPDHRSTSNLLES